MISDDTKGQLRPGNAIAHRSPALAVLLAAGLAAAGCSASVAPPRLDTGAGLSCVDDSPHCIKQRAASLQAFNASKDRSWVKQPASPKAYASGVRMFALRGKKGELTCDELAHARREADGARKTLRAPGAGLSPAQISRGMMLAGEVGRDLAREFKRRCKGRG